MANHEALIREAFSAVLGSDDPVLGLNDQEFTQQVSGSQLAADAQRLYHPELIGRDPLYEITGINEFLAILHSYRKKMVRIDYTIDQIVSLNLSSSRVSWQAQGETAEPFGPFGAGQQIAVSGESLCTFRDDLIAEVVQSWTT